MGVPYFAGREGVWVRALQLDDRVPAVDRRGRVRHLDPRRVRARHLSLGGAATESSQSSVIPR